MNIIEDFERNVLRRVEDCIVLQKSYPKFEKVDLKPSYLFLGISLGALFSKLGNSIKK